MDLREITAALEDARVAVGAEAEEVAQYAQERARHLAGILASNEPGFQEALLAERDNVALKAGISVAETSSSVALGVIQGFLALLVRVLA